ncbi:MAG: T9SS type A sorting domain-containing protein [Bacteroidota bacterium]
MDYIADQERDVVFELWKGDNTWLANGRTTVTSGTGTATATFTLAEAPVPADDYLIKASIRPVGTNWMENLSSCNQNDVTLTETTSTGTPTAGQTTYRVFPNPLGAGELHLDKLQGETLLRVYDGRGRKVLEQRLTGTEAQIPAAAFPATGVYLLRLEGKQGVVTKRLVKR